jgi:hypothetical protein
MTGRFRVGRNLQTSPARATSGRPKQKQAFELCRMFFDKYLINNNYA